MLRIGEIRSLLPDQARIMALTATATEKLRKTASSIIGLRDEVVVSKSPCKNNIMYVVVESAAIEEVFMPIAKRLHEDRSSYPRTLIYCRSSYTDCSSIYLFFKKFLLQVFLLRVFSSHAFHKIEVYFSFRTLCRRGLIPLPHTSPRCGLRPHGTQPPPQSNFPRYGPACMERNSLECDPKGREAI